MESMVSPLRVSPVNEVPVREQGRYVLYWMTAYRRSRYNHALEYAVEMARDLDRPLLVMEGLRVGYPWACDRFHRFVLDGMRANREAFEAAGVRYYPYVEREEGQGKGLLKRLSEEACAVVCDDWPAFFLPRMRKAAAEQVTTALIGVDSNGMVPVKAPEKMFLRAYDFRRWIHDRAEKIAAAPIREEPLKGVEWGDPVAVPKGVEERWPEATEEMLEASEEVLGKLGIDHSVTVSEFRGGYREASNRLRRFVEEQLSDYEDRRNHPGEQATSQLSPYLHFGHISGREIFEAIRAREGWEPEKIDRSRHGKNSGFWGMSGSAEAYLDQVLTWRELGLNRCVWDPEGYDQYESLPEWAKETLREHAEDERPYVYSLEEFDAAATHDELWNAAQRELKQTGIMHNYMRMLWGKKILHWSKTPREALDIMVELNNRYGLDGRDPNSYSGIFWVLGRFDRPWGPEREVFGKVRYMTSKSTRRKFNVDAYLERFGA